MAGYVSLSDIAQAYYSTPPLNIVRCVRRDLVEPCDYENDAMWDDKGRFNHRITMVLQYIYNTQFCNMHENYAAEQIVIMGNGFIIFCYHIITQSNNPNIRTI